MQTKKPYQQYFFRCKIPKDLDKTFAQKDFQGKATYMSKTTMDMNRFGEKMSEQQKKQMMARFKNFLEKNYTLSFNKTESSFKEDGTSNSIETASGVSFWMFLIVNE